MTYQPLADVPETARSIRILRGARGAVLAAIGEVLAADAFDLGRRGEIDRRGGAVVGGAEEGAQERDQRARPGAVVLAQAGRHRARVETVRGDAAAFQALRQLVSEQNVGEL